MTVRYIASVEQLLGNFVNSMSKVFYIFRRYSSHRYSSVFRKINTEIFGQSLDLQKHTINYSFMFKKYKIVIIKLRYLRSFQASKAEHADLVGDVGPISSATILLQIVTKLCTYRYNTVGHTFHISQP